MERTIRPVSFAVLIPSRGRWDVLGRAFERMPFLNRPNVYLGVDTDEYREYTARLPARSLLRARIVNYSNKEGSVGFAREQLRKAATVDKYAWYVATDDNAKFTEESLIALVQSAEAWALKTEKLTFVCGMHSTAAHFDRTLIKRKETVDGWTTYPGINFIFHAVPHAWYAKYSYPRGCFALEDRHMMLSAIDAGHREFRVCMDAPFSKSRYQHGGQGDITKRQWNCGRAIEQLAHDFPAMVGARGTLPLPWQFIIKLRDGMVVDRLSGGAMRKGADLEVKPKTMTIRRRGHKR